MKCPRCNGFATAKRCGSCGWQAGDSMPTDRHEELRAEVLGYLSVHRPDLAELFCSGEAVSARVAAAVAPLREEINAVAEELQSMKASMRSALRDLAAAPAPAEAAAPAAPSAEWPLGPGDGVHSELGQGVADGVHLCGKCGMGHVPAVKDLAECPHCGEIEVRG
ncbi:MAG: hypothetical protein RIR25_615 [Verrucomicrobiota bacterium]